MSDLQITIDAHLHAYGEPDAARREGLVRRVWVGDGSSVLSGLDVAEVGNDRLLRRVVGFLGPVPTKEG